MSEGVRPSALGLGLRVDDIEGLLRRNAQGLLASGVQARRQGTARPVIDW